MYDLVDAKLYAYKLTKDSDGYSVANVKESEVFAKIKSVNYKEFYQAYALGIKPTMIASVDVFDYREAFFDDKEPSRMLIDGCYYKIIRAYADQLDYVELTLERDNRNGDDTQ